VFNATKIIELTAVQSTDNKGNASVKRIIYNLTHIIKAKSNTEVDKSTIEPIIELLDEIDRNEGDKTVLMKDVLSNARVVAHQEWISQISIFHFIVALALTLEYKSKLLDDFITNEIMFTPIERMYGVEDSLVHMALTIPIHVLENVVNRIANAITGHDTIVLKGPKGVGKKSIVLGLIKAIALFKYPLLHNCNILLNPSKKKADDTINKYPGAFTICIVTSTTSENIFQKPSWEGSNLSEQLRFIYVIEEGNEQMQKFIDTISPFVSEIINIEEPGDKDIKEILKAHLYAVKDYIKLEYSEDVLDYIIQAANRFEGQNSQPLKSINLTMEAIFSVMNTNMQRIDYDEKLPVSINAMDGEASNKLLEIFRNGCHTRYIENIIKPIELDTTTIEKFIVKRYDLSSEVLASMMSTNIREHLKGLNRKMKNVIFGQDETIDDITNSLWRRGLKFDVMERPVSYMFIGSTGTGKTWTSKTLAQNLLGDVKKMERFDMSEYQEKHELSKLIGSPPGYVGSNQPGRLTEVVRKNPYAILLFDEIEKAHIDILNIFLQILDDGRLTDNHGTTVDFSRTIIIMTSNVGVSSGGSDAVMGFGAKQTEEDAEAKKKKLKAAAEDHFKPEFINRIDKIIAFNSLKDDEFKRIIKTRLDEIISNSILNISIKNEKQTIKDILKHARSKEYNIDKYNAREIKRVIVDKVEKAIIDYLSEHDTKSVIIGKDLDIRPGIKGLLK
jgi:hypothetical protein